VTDVPDLTEDRALDTLDVDLPDDPARALDVLAEHLVEARSEAASHLADLQRLAADYENYRKRSERDRDGMIASAARRVSEALLPVLDSLDAAAASHPETPGEERFRSGLTSTRDQLISVLASEGVHPIDVAEGDEFDPTIHEAVSGGGDGHLIVTSVMRRGYRVGDRLLRPAMVAVASEDLSAEP
jgi:molecular chaperone GrpE